MSDLLANPWVVGIGITIVGTVVAGLILYFVFGIGKTNDKQTEPKKSHSKLTPLEIVNYLDSLPPLQREDATNHYKGIKVSWVVRIGSSSKTNGNVRLITRYKRNAIPVIAFEIELVKYPELKIINKDQEIKVEGEIEDVSGLAIQLTNCTLYF